MLQCTVMHFLVFTVTAVTESKCCKRTSTKYYLSMGQVFYRWALPNSVWQEDTRFNSLFSRKPG